MSKALKAEWICQECYDKLGKEYECFCDANWLKEKCFYCNTNIGEHHAVNPPNELPDTLLGFPIIEREDIPGLQENDLVIGKFEDL